MLVISSWLRYNLTHQNQLFKVFRALWLNIDDVSFGSNNITAGYIKRYIQNVDATCSVRYSGDFRDPQMFIHAFGHRAAYLIGTAIRKRDIEKRSWNSLLVEIDRASHAHSQFILVRNFANVLMHDKTLLDNPALHYIMQLNFELFGKSYFVQC
jgi:acyl-CoA oxidase